MCFHPLNANEEWPTLLNNPFDYAPHPLCIRAAEQVREDIKQHQSWHEEVQKGKMFGVLLVEKADGERGYLTAFSGQIGGSDNWEGYVPLVYNYLEEGQYFKVHEVEISEVNRKIEALESSNDYLSLLNSRSSIEKEAKKAIEEHCKQMAKAKALRDDLRQTNLDSCALERLLNESRFMKAELKRMKKHYNERLEEVNCQIKAVESEIEAMKVQRKSMSDALQTWLFERFEMLNCKGEKRNLIAIFNDFEQKMPPSGSGECCAPKLFQYAFQHNMRPLAVAEFWVGDSPRQIIRHDGYFYPACKHKCEPILRYMLEGVSMQEGARKPNAELSLTTLFEDESIRVVVKPSGMPSVEGHHSLASVEQLMRNEYPLADSPLIVHRLDMDTSGIMIIAKTKQAHKCLQEQFALHQVKKRYIAVLEGVFTHQPTCGCIALPLLPNVNERPLQMVDDVYGKEATTNYRVIEVEKQRTRVALYPQTGRTHQLRVHCSHREGLALPIVGDCLYGKSDTRLHLHAAAIALKHPVNGKRMVFKSAPPF